METLATLLHYAWSFTLVISIIVFVHEFGHFIVARACGVKIETFSIGFGRELIGRTDRHGTRWKLSAVPLGGYVKMYGDASAASTPDMAALNAMTSAERKRSLHHQPLWAKSLIVAAGPVANFLLTIAIFTYFIYTVGLASTAPVVGEVMLNTPAAEAGLQPGDRILTIDGKEMHRFQDIPEALITNLYTPVTLTLARGEAVLTLTLTPAETEEKDVGGNVMKRPIIGIRSQQITYRDVTFPEAVWLATEKTYTICVVNLHAIGQMLSGERSPRDLTGTLGIAKMSGDITQSGETTRETLLSILWWVALISTGVGFVNLLPLPVLDGGHLLFYTIEALRGRPASERVMEYSYRLGFSLLAMLMAFTLVNDTRKIFF